jgi:hypothetical protein
MRKQTMGALALSAFAVWAAGCPNGWEGGDPEEQDPPEENIGENLQGGGGCGEGCNHWRNTMNNTFDFGYNAGYRADCHTGTKQGYMFAWNASWNETYYTHPEHSNDPAIATKAWKSDEYAVAFDSKYNNGVTDIWSSDWNNSNINKDPFWVESTSTYPVANTGWSRCSHPIAEIGPALSSSCSPVVAAVCSMSGRAYCCDATNPTGWDKECMVQAVMNVAANPTGNTNAHHVLHAGGPLTQGGTGTCTDTVCNQSGMSYCCTNQWDSGCVEMASKVCYARYMKSVRVEAKNVPHPGQIAAEKRMLVDICLDPHQKALGANSTTQNNATYCPIATGTVAPYNSNTDMYACCRRAMVLRGSYRVEDVPTTGLRKGRVASWQLSRSLTKGDGSTQWVKSTIVPDAIVRYPNQSQSYGTRTEPHHLWQVAGARQYLDTGDGRWDVPGKLYPDCANGGTEKPCSTAPSDYKFQEVDTSHGSSQNGTANSHTPVRMLMVGALTALTTTNGEHQIELRYVNNETTSSFLVADPDWDIGDNNGAVQLEGAWSLHSTTYVGAGGLEKKYYAQAYCMSQEARQWGTRIVSGVGQCPSLLSGSDLLKTHHDKTMGADAD